MKSPEIPWNGHADPDEISPDDFICNYCGLRLGHKGHTWTQCSIDNPRQSVADMGYTVVPATTSDYTPDWDDLKDKWKKNNPDKTGMKFSEGKPRWQLMGPLWPAMEEVVKVLTRGAEKYVDNNWMDVGRDEYLRAIMSHYSAYASGERIDSDMGSNHMANLICSALFLLWHDGIKREIEDEESI